MIKGGERRHQETAPQTMVRSALHNILQDAWTDVHALGQTAVAGSCSYECFEQGQSVAENLTLTGKGQPWET